VPGTNGDAAAALWLAAALRGAVGGVVCVSPTVCRGTRTAGRAAAPSTLGRGASARRPLPRTGRACRRGPVFGVGGVPPSAVGPPALRRAVGGGRSTHRASGTGAAEGGVAAAVADGVGDPVAVAAVANVRAVFLFLLSRRLDAARAGDHLPADDVRAVAAAGTPSAMGGHGDRAGGGSVATLRAPRRAGGRCARRARGGGGASPSRRRRLAAVATPAAVPASVGDGRRRERPARGGCRRPRGSGWGVGRRALPPRRGRSSCRRRRCASEGVCAMDEGAAAGRVRLGWTNVCARGTRGGGLTWTRSSAPRRPHRASASGEDKGQASTASKAGSRFPRLDAPPVQRQSQWCWCCVFMSSSTSHRAGPTLDGLTSPLPLLTGPTFCGRSTRPTR